MTAEALLCRMYLGWKNDDVGLVKGVQHLRTRHPFRRHASDLYYCYYASQVFHHAGGEAWLEWNKEMREILVRTQVRRGRNAGSWDPRDGHSRTGGRLYATAIAACCLEVYYRHLPIFRQIDID